MASKSPRRIELLKMMGVDFEVVVSDAKEVIKPGLTKEQVAMDIALSKAKTVSKGYQNRVILGFDTIVMIENEILGKPRNQQEARAMLEKLSGHTHTVVTGGAYIYNEEEYLFYDKAEVRFKTLSKEEIEWYLDSNEYADKAGAYGIQGKAASFIEKIEGDYYSIMGLPLYRLFELLKEKSI